MNSKYDDYFNEKLIKLNTNFNNQNDAFKWIERQLQTLVKGIDENEIVKLFEAREKEISTDVGEGVAIPHLISKKIKQPLVCVIRNKKNINWPDDKHQIKVIIALIIPDQHNEEHINILSHIATKLLNKEIKTLLLNSNAKNEIIEALVSVDKKVVKLAKKDDGEQFYIVAVTSCPGGVAHTYMAAQALEDFAAENNYKIKVEKQGANGAEDKISIDDLAQADLAIISSDVNINERSRFNNIGCIKTSVSEPIKNINSIKEQVADYFKTYDKNAPKAIKEDDSLNFATARKITKHKVYRNPKVQTFMDSKGMNAFVRGAHNLKNAILTGISFVVPVIVASATVGSLVEIVRIIGLNASGDSQWLTHNALWLKQIESVAFNALGLLIAPVLAAYIAYAFADKPALAPGFVGGIAANFITMDKHGNYLNIPSDGVAIVNGLGFLGGLFAGIICGYLMMFLKRYMRVKNHSLQSLFTWFFYPVVGALIMIVIMLFVVGLPLAWLSLAIYNGLESLLRSNYAFILGAVIGLLCVTDLGGPFNKTAYAFSIMVFQQGIQPGGDTLLLIPYTSFWAAESELD